MSWCGGGEISVDARRRVAQAGDVVVDLVAGQLAALAGLGALGDLDLDLVGVARYSIVTPKRPEATCLMRASGRRRSAKRPGPRRPRRCSTGRRAGSSRSRASRAPPARARRGSSPPVEKRLTISLAGSTSSSGTGSVRRPRSCSRPRSVECLAASSLTQVVKRVVGLAGSSPRAACWRSAIVSGFQPWNSPLAAPGVDRRRRGSSSGRGRPGRRGAWRSSASPASSSKPIPPIREGVPVKWRSISSRSSPIASKICAPR